VIPDFRLLDLKVPLAGASFRNVARIEIDVPLQYAEFIAELHDPEREVTAAELAAFSPEQLMPLVTGVLGDGSAWWARAAWRILQQDDAARWTPLLLQGYDEAETERDRVELVVVLDGLGDPAATEGLSARLEDLRLIRENREARRRGSLYAALVLAVEGQPEPQLVNRK